MDNLIIVFLLFAAVLVFGWFYLQRAKARDARTTVETTETAAATEAQAPATPAAATEEPRAESTTREA